MRPQYPPNQWSLLRGLRRDVESLKRRPPPSSSRVVIAIKMVSDSDLVEGSVAFSFVADHDMDGLYLAAADAYVTRGDMEYDPPASPLELNVFNWTAVADMLSTPITIDANEYTSFTSATPSVPAGPDSLVQLGDEIVPYLSDEGDGDAHGLGVILTFEPGTS